MNNDASDWPAQPWILAVFLALAGYVYFLIFDRISFASDEVDQMVAAATFVAVGSMTFVFSVQKNKWFWACVFSILWGVIIAAALYSNIASNAHKFEFNFTILAALLSAAIALPLFQTARDYNWLKLPYPTVHRYAWNDFLGGATALLFVGISYALLFLISSLFKLIGLNFLERLFDFEWFFIVFNGAAFGGSLGVLKQNSKIVSSIQNLVMTVLSILSPLLCFGLIVFLFSLPFTGLHSLWDATRNTSAILITCAFGSVLLSNAILRDDVGQESSNRILRFSALGLALCILPLAIISIISVNIRVSQHGLSPDRIWAMIIVTVAIAYGLAYLLAVLRKRKSWMSGIRSSNIVLAMTLCLAALFLAAPILNFNKISTEDQVARLEDGRTTADDFDFAALAFDFGPEGRAFLKKQQQSDDPTMVKGAKTALEATSRWNAKNEIHTQAQVTTIENNIQVLPVQIDIPEKLKNIIIANGSCIKGYCTLIWLETSDIAQLITSSCHNTHTNTKPGNCAPMVWALNRTENDWQINYNSLRVRNPDIKKQGYDMFWDDLAKGQIEYRSVERQQLFIGGRPIGQPY